MKKYIRKFDTEFKEEKFNESLQIPRSVAGDVKYWDSFPIKTLEQLRKAYAELENDNDHTGCVYLLAKFKKNKKTMQILIYITAIHDEIGSMPKEIYDYRYRLSTELEKGIF